MKAVFFDLDGTLFDTRADLAATVNHTRRDLGLPEKSEAEIIACVGQGARYLLTHAVPERFAGLRDAESASAFDETWRIFRTHYAEHCCERLTPYPGVLSTLDALAARGWRLGVNTNKPNFAVKAILEKFDLSRRFGAAVVAGGDGIALKPSAASLFACAERMGGHVLSPDDWMVGDSWTDLQCAANAGVRSVFCAFGFGSRGDSPCTMLINRFDELLALDGDRGNSV